MLFTTSQLWKTMVGLGTSSAVNVGVRLKYFLLVSGQTMHGSKNEVTCEEGWGGHVMAPCDLHIRYRYTQRRVACGHLLI